MLKLLLIIAISLSFVSCTKKISSTDYGLNLKETLRLIIATEPPTLDWSKSSDTASSFITENLMEGLVGYDFSGPVVALKPALAKSWTSSNNSKTWEFILRDDVVWTDGQKLTPQQVVDGWERLLNPETASVYAYFLFGLKNAQKYNNSQITDFSKVGVKIEGQKIKVELNEPANFPYLLTHHSTYPVRNDIINKYGDRWTEAENIVTLGVYKLKVWDHDRALVFERNETYFDEPAKIKNVICYIIEEQTTALNLFKGGQVDALMTLPSSLLGVLKKMPEYQQGPALVTYYYGYNIAKPPTDNLYLRQAISSAIDRKQVTDMLQGGQTPLSGWIPKGMFGHDIKAGHQFDLKKALQHYKKAGYSLEKPAPRIVLAFNTNEDHKRIAENIQSQLKKNLNLTVEINNEEWKVYLGTLQSDPPHMYRMGWVADYPDPYNFFELMTSTSDNNHTGWEDPSFDVLLRKSAETTDLDKKLSLYAQAENKLLVQATAAFPLYSSVNQQLVSNRIKDFPKNVMSRYHLKDVEVVK
jgi:oligopeptide transport system substrate-binding protein